mgnify:CR=1 FL=1
MSKNKNTFSMLDVEDDDVVIGGYDLVNQKLICYVKIIIPLKKKRGKDGKKNPGLLRRLRKVQKHFGL